MPITSIQALQKIESLIYSTPYDDLSDYLKGVRDIVNLLNNSEPANDVASYIINQLSKGLNNARPIAY